MKAKRDGVLMATNETILIRGDQTKTCRGKVTWYIKMKPTGFGRFFIDEVGQYISSNTKLMLNLQATETLATTLEPKTVRVISCHCERHKISRA
jgi:hypothetical protein